MCQAMSLVPSDHSLGGKDMYAYNGEQLIFRWEDCISDEYSAASYSQKQL